MLSWTVLLSFTIVLNSVFSARILCIYPTPSISHQVVFRAVTAELVKRGHQVTVLTPDPMYQKGKGPANLIEIDVHDLSYEHWNEAVVSKLNGANAAEILKASIKSNLDIFEKQINSNAFKETLKNSTLLSFDLIITEPLVRPAVVFSYVYNAPVIHLSSTGAIFTYYNAYGIPSHPFIYPVLGVEKLYNLTVWDKMEQLFKYYYSWNLLWDDNYENELLRRNFGSQVPPISELISKVDLSLLNLHSIWECNRAVPPGVIHLSGLHLTQKKALPQELESYLNNSKHGVIYVSFGTNFEPSILPLRQLEKFNKVFARLPYDVIWKWNKEVMPAKATNVRLMKWLPQADLLRHPKIKVFLTQAGLQSTDEAIDAEVPLIAFPTAADQWYNAEQYVHHKIGVQLDLLNFTEDQLYDAVTTVIEDESYRQNIKKLSNIIKDSPDTAVNTAAWWIEYAIRHGGAKHLRSRAANVSWSEYLMLDVVFALIFILVLSSIAMAVAIQFILRRFRKTKQKKM